MLTVNCQTFPASPKRLVNPTDKILLRTIVSSAPSPLPQTPFANVDKLDIPGHVICRVTSLKSPVDDAATWKIRIACQNQTRLIRVESGC